MEEKELIEKLDAVKVAAVKEAKEQAAKEIGDTVKAEVEKQTADIKVKSEGWEKRAKELEAEFAKQKKFGSPVNEDHMEKALTDNADKLKQVQSGEFSGKLNMSVKAFDKKAAAITLTNYTGGTYGITQLDPEFDRPARRSPYLRQLVRSFPVSSKYITWVEMINRTGAAGNTAEGATKSISDFQYQEQTKQVEKITMYMKASKESLDDIGRLQSDIQTELLEGLALKLDADLYSGSGTTPVIKGIATYAPTLSVTGTPFITTGGGIKSANRMDILRVAAWSVNNNFFQPNYVALNSVDAAQLDLVKDSNGQYLLPPFSTSEHSNIAGMRVVVNNGVTAGTFLVGDFSKSNLGVREDINISIGYDQDDFTKNMVTILGELRAVHYIKANHINAFVQGTFATLITATSV